MPILTPPALRGPADPVADAPELAPGATRRMTTIDVRWPGEERWASAHGADLVDGKDDVTGALELKVASDGAVRWLEVTGRRVSGLDGASATRRFRDAAAVVFPAERRGRTVLWTILDDLPAIVAVAMYGRVANGYTPPWVRRGGPKKVDVCAGWRGDGSFVRQSVANGHQMLTIGPPAPPAVSRAPSPEPLTIRRHRRLDVRSGDPVVLDAFYRDTYTDATGTETVVHEYSMDVTVDPGTTTVASVDVHVGMLPYVECPLALASAQSAVGQPLATLRDVLKETLVGTSTCTHLTNMLRSLEDAVPLLLAVP